MGNTSFISPLPFLLKRAILSFKEPYISYFHQEVWTMSDKTAQKIILSADSTCDLDEELKVRYNVNYFPLHIILNEKQYRDNVDITPEEIYQEYYDHKTLPKTAAVNVQEYRKEGRQISSRTGDGWS